MKIPLTWLKEFASLPATISHEDIENAFVRVGFEVESVEVAGADITGPLVVARIESIEELEGHKKPIRYVGLDCGEGETRFVICGARNFEVGDLVVAALPGAVLPGDFAIAERETYGRISNGMICSARELRLSEDHAGIINLPAESAKPGDNAREILSVDDVIFDIAINPDRGYALSVRGLARELAASLGVSYTDPAVKIDVSEYEINSRGIPAVIDDPSAATHIFLRTVETVNPDAQTPLWMYRRIEKCGMRSISLIVDITNYVMLELGQPLHAFDADKISGSLHVQRAGSYKSLKTLDEVDRELHPEDLIIADDSQPLAIAGVMGGATSEVTGNTTRIALEGVRFDPISIAKNSRRHKLSTEASRRLERAVDPLLAELATARGISLMIQLAGAAYVGTSTQGSPVLPESFSLTSSSISAILGIPLTNEVVTEKLSLIGAEVVAEGDSLRITPPSWRADLLATPDFTEEVARNIGFDSIPSRLPTGKFGAALTPAQKRKREFGQYLSANGFTEVYCFPFINAALLASMGFVGERAKGFEIANPMSDENPLFRTHMLPGLILTAARNINRGIHNVGIFEIGSIARGEYSGGEIGILPTDRRPTPSELEKIYNSVPNQQQMLAGVVTGSLNSAGWWGKPAAYSWSEAVGQVAEMLTLSGAEFEIVASDLAPWHPGRCAEFQVNGKAVAHAGEIHPRVCREFGLPVGSTAFGILLGAFDHQPPRKATPVWSMPAAIQDISLFIDSYINSAEVEKALKIGAGELLESISLFDRYVKPEDSSRVSLAYSLVFRAPDRTLTAEEVSGYREAAGAKAVEICGAELRSE